MSRRPNLLAAPALLAALLVSLAGCGSTGPTAEGVALLDEVAPGAWGRLPDVPLTPRDGPVVVTVGGRVVVVGGYDGPVCPPNADCARPETGRRADGAAYDPASGTWEAIADAPEPLGERPPFAVVGDDLYVMAGSRLLRWSSASDEWAGVSSPPLAEWPALVPDGDRLLVVSGTDERGVVPDRTYTPATDAWGVLPENPLAPAFDRLLVPTAEGVVLVARRLTLSGDLRDPSYVSAALLDPDDATWREYGGTEDVLGGGAWHWTGARMVGVALGGADGGEVNNYGRTIPFGGRLDPATGEWSTLPGAPVEGSGGWTVEAASGALVATSGWLYDDAAERWRLLERPQGAPGEPGPATWIDGVLVVVGGQDWGERGRSEEGEDEDVRSVGVWAFRP